MTSFQGLLCPPPLPSLVRDSSPKRMNAADREKGVRVENGGTVEVSHIQTNILHSDNSMGGVRGTE